MEEYLGYREVCLSDEDMAAFYSGQLEDNFGCLTNEYLLLKNTNDELCDQVRWTGEQFEEISNSSWLLICCITKTSR